MRRLAFRSAMVEFSGAGYDQLYKQKDNLMRGSIKNSSKDMPQLHSFKAPMVRKHGVDYRNNPFWEDQYLADMV